MARRTFCPRWLRLYKTIAVVGNGPVDPRHAPTIDAHDMVIRFNACRNYGVAGYRTDVLVLCNTGEPSERFAYDGAAINPDALASARSFWLAKPPDFVAAERAVCRPDHASFWTTRDEDIVRNRLAGRPWQYISADACRLAKCTLRAYGASIDDMASTGILALFQIRQSVRRLRLCRVTLYGFNHQGWNRHPWPTERAIIDTWQDWVIRAP